MLEIDSLPFHPLIKRWFSNTYGSPTAVQKEAWPLIAGGEHVLALAPTGSGKTLTAFLGALSRFVEGEYPVDQCAVLYVSPLKALNEDIKRNLLSPLGGIKKEFTAAGLPFPEIRVETRSGDTPQSERRRFLHKPPSILALTPESLALILLNPRGRRVLSAVRCLILDEIHTALGSKRGSYLSCQIDRLAETAGEFQRIALSATVKLPQECADFAGGLRLNPQGEYEKRPFRIVAPASKKDLEIKVIYPQRWEEEEITPGQSRFGRAYAALVNFILERIRARQGGTILVFTDSRRRSERINRLLNTAAQSMGPESMGHQRGLISYCHHGSLSKEVRREVEKALVNGEVPCVVATGSLELGIDIGQVDEVILAGTPNSTGAALQRLGRSGHGVGEVSRGWIFPFHGMDLLQAAALAGALEERELEPVYSIENPLDILAQIIMALVAEKDRDEDELYRCLQGYYIFRNLPRQSYDEVLAMLTGAFEGIRLRELQRRIFRDEESRILRASPSLLGILYTSGGVISSRGYFTMRISSGAPVGGRTKIGELDEEFVWERRVGDSFDFGNKSWRITAIGNEAVEVVPLRSNTDNTPFWKGEALYRSDPLSYRMLQILQSCQEKDWQRGAEKELLKHLDPAALEALDGFLSLQKTMQGSSPLSNPAHGAIEIIDDMDGRQDAFLVILHTFRGGALNAPLAMALTRELESHWNIRMEGSSDNNGVFLRIPRSITAEPEAAIRESLRRLCQKGEGERCFKERLESSGVFGAAFREAAERSLILRRAPFGKRTPLWVMRERSRRLFDALTSSKKSEGAFPVITEAWRSCLHDQFAMDDFRSYLDEIDQGLISLGFFRSPRMSPFSGTMGWIETNALMYQYDDRPDLMGPHRTKAVSVPDQVVMDALGAPSLRPLLKEELLDDFVSRLKREIKGWAPEDPLSLSEWVKERVALGQEGDWKRLLSVLGPPLLEALEEDPSLGGTLVYLRREGAGEDLVTHRDWVKRWKDPEDDSSYLAQWLRYEGPVSSEQILSLFGLDEGAAEEALEALSEEEVLVRDVYIEGMEAPLICDKENLELLLRLHRRDRRREAQPLQEQKPDLLVPLLARRQGLLGGDLVWDSLSGIFASFKLWETEFLPARIGGYTAEILDREISQGRILWSGGGKERICFSRLEDMDLVLPPAPPPFQKKQGPYIREDFFDLPKSFWELKDALAGASPGEDSIKATVRLIWEEVWRGSLSADSFEPLRRALAEGFAQEEPPEPVAPELGFASGASSRRGAARRIPRHLSQRWKQGAPLKGAWFSLGEDPSMEEPEEPDLLGEHELNRSRVQILLKRWGILARPLLEREQPLLSWSRLLPTMRRMELSGELLSGYFFTGIPSLQYASPVIGRDIQEALEEKRIYWMNAMDSASPAGLEIEGLLARPIRRLPSTRLCYRGRELAAVSYRNGRELEVLIESEDPDLKAVLEFIKIPRTRAIQRETKITIEKINGQNAHLSPYLGTLLDLGFIKDRSKLVYW
ncbi:MAG: DEAD/DEAH box helicase [Treponema sp.]|nr:DEAD/DEAH box helicase [Treponema sp.]